MQIILYLETGHKFHNIYVYKTSIRFYTLMFHYYLMWLEKKVNKRLIDFIIWWSIFKLVKWELKLKKRRSWLDKVKGFFDAWVKEIKKDIDKISNW